MTLVKRCWKRTAIVSPLAIPPPFPRKGSQARQVRYDPGPRGRKWAPDRPWKPLMRSAFGVHREPRKPRGNRPRPTAGRTTSALPNKKESKQEGGSNDWTPRHHTSRQNRIVASAPFSITSATSRLEPPPFFFHSLRQAAGRANCDAIVSRILLTAPRFRSSGRLSSAVAQPSFRLCSSTSARPNAKEQEHR